MANTDSVQLADSIAAEILADDLVATAYAAAQADRVIAHDFVQGSLTKSYPRLAKFTAAALTEGTDGVATAITDTQVSATIAEIGIGVALTDLARVGASIKSMAAKIARHLGRAYANKIDVDILALSSSLTSSVGTTTVAANEDTWFQAIFQVATNDAYGNLLSFLYPKQIQQLMQAIGGVTENQSTIWSRMDFLSGMSPGDVTGYVTTLGSIPVFQSTNVPTANAAADSGGMIIVAGDESPFVRVIGLLEETGLMDAMSGSGNPQPWDGRLEFQRDASLRATEAWVTGATGLAVRAPERGCRYLSVR